MLLVTRYALQWGVLNISVLIINSISLGTIYELVSWLCPRLVMRFVDAAPKQFLPLNRLWSDTAYALNIRMCCGSKLHHHGTIATWFLFWYWPTPKIILAWPSASFADFLLSIRNWLFCVHLINILVSKLFCPIKLEIQPDVLSY